MWKKPYLWYVYHAILFKELVRFFKVNGMLVTHSCMTDGLLMLSAHAETMHAGGSFGG